MLLHGEMYCYSIYVGMCCMNWYYTTKITSVTDKDLTVEATYIEIVAMCKLLNIILFLCIP